MPDSFKPFPRAGLALDPIHVGAGGSRLGRVDNTIVRDPVTRVPKIPGSSLAGVFRAYAAMAKGKYPDCAGQGQLRNNGTGSHCGKADCPVCTVFGFARGNAGGFAGLAAFSDGHVLLFPVATREGPVWLTCPSALQGTETLRAFPDVIEDAIHRRQAAQQPLNLGWLMLPVKAVPSRWPDVYGEMTKLGVPDYVRDRVGVISDKLFGHVVNSNLAVEWRIDPDGVWHDSQ